MLDLPLVEESYNSLYRIIFSFLLNSLIVRLAHVNRLLTFNKISLIFLSILAFLIPTVAFATPSDTGLETNSASGAPIVLLDPPAKRANIGQPITFTGTLQDVNGNPIAGAKVTIRQDAQFGTYARTLGPSFTGIDGKFSVNWIAEFPRGYIGGPDQIQEVPVAILYASFAGDQHYLKARSEEVRMTLSTNVILTLGILPDRGEFSEGDEIRFYGTAKYIDGSQIIGKEIKIKKANDPIGGDNWASAVTNHEGSFSVSGNVQRIQPDSVYAIYASYDDKTLKGISPHIQFAVSGPNQANENLQLVTCDLFSDIRPFDVVDEQGERINAKGIRGEVSILLRTPSGTTISPGESINLPYNARPGKLTLNLVQDDGSVYPISFTVNTPLTDLPIPIPYLDGYEVRLNPLFQADVSAFGAGAVEPTKIKWDEDWGSNNVRLSSFSDAKEGREIDMTLRSYYSLVGSITADGKRVGPEIGAERYCIPDISKTITISTGTEDGNGSPDNQSPPPSGSDDVNVNFAMQPIRITDVNTNAFVTDIKVHQQIRLSTEVTMLQSETETVQEEQPLVVITEIRANDETTIFLEISQDAVTSDRQLPVELIWAADRPGNYQARTFAVDSLDVPRLFSNPSVIEFTVSE